MNYYSLLLEAKLKQREVQTDMDTDYMREDALSEHKIVQNRRFQIRRRRTEAID